MKYLLISVKPQYVRLFEEGIKLVELRKLVPKVCGGDILVLYSSSPVRAIVGYAKIRNVEKDSPMHIWERYNGKVGIDRNEFDKYFVNKKSAVAILIEAFHPTDLIHTHQINAVIPNFHAPQQFKYLCQNEVNILFRNNIDCNSYL